MDKEQAIRILSSDTSAEEIHKLKYYAGFNQGKIIEQVQEAMDMGADALKNDNSINRLINYIKSKDIELSLKSEYSLHYGWIVKVIRKGYDIPILEITGKDFNDVLEKTYLMLPDINFDIYK